MRFVHRSLIATAVLLEAARETARRPVTNDAPAPVRPPRDTDCGCHQRTPRFPKPLPRPEDAK